MSGGNKASKIAFSSVAPEGDLPWPRSIAAVIPSFGKPALFAFAMTRARRGLDVGSAPKSAGVTID